MRRAVAAAALIVVALLLGACESSQTKSARIARTVTSQSVQTSKVVLGTPPAGLKIVQATVVTGGGTAAVAVELRNDGSKPATNVPVLLDVSDASGTSVYRNDDTGIQPALQRMSLVPAGKSVWWVDDQIGVATAKAVKAQVGADGPAAADAGVALEHVKVSTTAGTVTGSVVNHTTTSQVGLLVYAVALRGGKVVGAGRAIIPSLPGKGVPVPTTFTVTLVGSAKDADVQTSIWPAAAGA